ncbi:MAG: metalloregulator ArsR/SmtB family transcription factor [Actinomycetota bacterium]|nr:metalloregulator ArsR/SmtB family transcription factor [Actinomycetota bacterium]
MDTQISNKDETDIEDAVELLKMIADRTRLKVVRELLHSEHSVNELADHLEVKPAALSQHLAKLRLARLVSIRREGTRVFYRISDPHIEKIVDSVMAHVGESQIDVASLEITQ